MSEFISSEFSLSVIVTFPLPKVASVLSLWYPTIFSKARDEDVTSILLVSDIPTFAPTLKLLFELYTESVVFEYVNVFVSRFRFSIFIRVKS